MKPIIVIANKEIYEFSDIDEAKAAARILSGTVYRRDDFYQYLQMWLKILIERV